MTSKIIENPKVLTQDYIPDSFVHREGQHHRIADGLRPMLDGKPPADMLLYGPPGAGKTAMSRFVIRKLKQEMFIEDSYVNGFSHDSKFGVFYKLLDMPLKVPRDGCSTEEVVNRFSEKIEDNNAVLIVDEVDQIQDDQTIYELSKLVEAGVIYISNQGDVFSGFGERVESRMTKVDKIRFERYSAQELADILQSRKKHGLADGSITKQGLEKIAEASKGDARIAVNSLRKAARKAETADEQEISDDIIQESVEEAISSNKTESLEKLNRHQKTIYEIVQRNQGVRMGKIYSKYKEEIDSPKSRRTAKRYISKMESYGLVETRGRKAATRYYLAS
jgi:orc1/cdc6 family replication initiation protein